MSLSLSRLLLVDYLSNFTAMRRAYLLSLFLLHALVHRVEPNESSEQSSKPTFQRNIELGDKKFDVLVVENGEEPADVIYRFSSTHGLNKDERSVLQGKVCELTTCLREKAIISRTVVGNHLGEDIGEVVIMEDEEPADVVHQFVLRLNLKRELRKMLMAEICAVVKCSRQEPGEFISIDSNHALQYYSNAASPSSDLSCLQ